jgi:hypothetical protein
MREKSTAKRLGPNDDTIDVLVWLWCALTFAGGTRQLGEAQLRGETHPTGHGEWD